MPRKTDKSPARGGGTGPFGLYGPIMHLGLLGPTAGPVPRRPPHKGPTGPGKGKPDVRRPQLPRRNGG